MTAVIKEDLSQSNIDTSFFEELGLKKPILRSFTGSRADAAPIPIRSSPIVRAAVVLKRIHFFMVFPPI